MMRARVERAVQRLPFRLPGAGGMTGGTAVLFLASVGDRGLALAGSAIIARLYDPAAVGLIAPALVLSAIVSRVFEFGVPLVIQRESARAPESAPGLLRLGLGLRLAGNVLMLALLGAYGLLVGGSAAAALVAVLAGAAAAFTGIAQLAQAVFLGRMRAGHVAATQLAYRVAYLAAIAAAGLVGAPITGMLALLVVAGAVQAAVAIWLLHRHYFAGRPVWRPAEWRPLLMVSWPLGMSAIMVLTYDRVDTLIASWYVPAHDVGNYYNAYAIYGSALLFANAFNNMAYSEVARRGRESLAAAAAFYRRAVVTILALGALCMLGVWGLRHVAVGVLFGPRYAEAATYVGVLALALPFVFGNNLGGVTLNALDRARATLVLMLVGLACNVALNILLVPRHGAVAAAWATVATEALVCLLTMVMLGVTFRRTAAAVPLTPALHGD